MGKSEILKGLQIKNSIPEGQGSKSLNVRRLSPDNDTLKFEKVVIIEEFICLFVRKDIFSMQRKRKNKNVNNFAMMHLEKTWPVPKVNRI